MEEIRMEQEEPVVGGDDDFWKWWSHATTNREREREKERERDRERERERERERRRKAAHLAATANNCKMVVAA